MNLDVGTVVKLNNLNQRRGNRELFINKIVIIQTAFSFNNEMVGGISLKHNDEIFYLIIYTNELQILSQTNMYRSQCFNCNNYTKKIKIKNGLITYCPKCLM